MAVTPSEVLAAMVKAMRERGIDPKKVEHQIQQALAVAEALGWELRPTKPMTAHEIIGMVVDQMVRQSGGQITEAEAMDRLRRELAAAPKVDVLNQRALKGRAS